jgi:hypothetical protein
MRVGVKLEMPLTRVLPTAVHGQAEAARSIVNPSFAELSVHVRLICDDGTAVALRLLGAAGGSAGRGARCWRGRVPALAYAAMEGGS